MFDEHKSTWKNEKHRYQWLRTVEVWAYPVIGDRPAGTIERPDILRVLQPVWLKQPETARRLRQRLKFIFDWARAHNLRSGDNPVEGVEKVLPRQTDEVEHMKALPIDAMPDFIAKLRARDADAVTKLAFEFLILTAARTGEAINARWSEIDFEARTWTVPKERMKAGVKHVVPLTERTIAILKQASSLYRRRVCVSRQYVMKAQHRCDPTASKFRTAGILLRQSYSLRPGFDLRTLRLDRAARRVSAPSASSMARVSSLRSVSDSR